MNKQGVPNKDICKRIRFPPVLFRTLEYVTWKINFAKVPYVWGTLAKLNKFSLTALTAKTDQNYKSILKFRNSTVSLQGFWLVLISTVEHENWNFLGYHNSNSIEWIISNHLTLIFLSNNYWLRLDLNLRPFSVASLAHTTYSWNIKWQK